MPIQATVSRQDALHFIAVSLLFSLALLGARPLAAQTATGTITGTVTDPTGLRMVDVGLSSNLHVN